MEQIIVGLGILIIVAAIVFLRRRSKTETPEPPIVTPAPSKPEIEEIFRAGSVIETEMQDIVTSIQFLANGDVKSTYTLGENIKTSILGNVSADFSPNPIEFRVFDITEITSVTVDGPRSGVLADEPKWTLNLPLGLSTIAIYVELTDGTTTKVFRLELSQEVTSFPRL